MWLQHRHHLIFSFFERCAYIMLSGSNLIGLFSTIALETVYVVKKSKRTRLLQTWLATFEKQSQCSFWFCLRHLSLIVFYEIVECVVTFSLHSSERNLKELWIALDLLASNDSFFFWLHHSLWTFSVGKLNWCWISRLRTGRGGKDIGYLFLYSKRTNDFNTNREDIL